MTRRARQRVTRPDGTVAVQTAPPRADVLRYPHLGDQVTVLVRRTHDEELARQLADVAWSGVDDPRPLGPCRRGWWTTTPPRAVTVIPRHAAVDETGRTVTWIPDTQVARSVAGPGVEFRPARPSERTQENTR